MGRMGRTFAIGDIHGEATHLERLLAHLPPLTSDDTLVFLGDYMDRGPDSARVFDIIWSLPHKVPAKVVTLLGNHEEAWLRCLNHPEPGFLLRPDNGCFQALQSIAHVDALPEIEQAAMLLSPQKWFPPELATWLTSLPLYYEDEHAIYVHAGLDGEGEVWHHPRDSRPRNLLWCREPDFFRGYKGKRLCFGHTITKELPVDHLSWFAKILDDPTDVWFRGDLIGLDTACGKGGYLSAVELPSCKIYTSR
jgi:serine/threonine protein phosphatase 1